MEAAGGFAGGPPDAPIAGGRLFDGGGVLLAGDAT